MTQLKAQINRATKIATFFGPGTFEAKDQIKQLGPAFWVKDKKIWEVRSFTIPENKLRDIFPSIEIEEIGAAGEGSAGEGTSPSSTIEPKAQNSEATGLPPSVSVSELSRQISGLLQQAFPRTIFVRGVLSKVTRREKAVYLQIVDSEQRDEEIDAVIWDHVEEICQPLVKAGFQLEPDLEVMFEVQVRLRTKRAQVSLHIVGVVAEYTIGKLAALREITNERLRKEGLFEKNKQLTLPFLPRRIGILTSTAGAVINDFRAALDQAHFGFQLFLLHASVQGSEAKQQIIRGLRQLETLPELDAIVVIRGGGSPAELSVFNDYEVARAVCLCAVPVLTAVGHQADQSSAQDVSFRAFGVPKEVGHFLAEIILDLRRRCREATNIVVRLVGPAITTYQGYVENLAASIAALSKAMIEQRQAQFLHHSQLLRTVGQGNIDREDSRLGRVVNGLANLGAIIHQRSVQHFQRVGERVISVGKHQVELAYRQLLVKTELRPAAMRLVQQSVLRVQHYETLFHGLSPAVQLRRGFALIQRMDNEYITSGSSVKPGDTVRIEFHDTTRQAVIKE